MNLAPDAAPVTLAPKATALFVYLAVTRGPHSRDTVADLLWSDMNNQQARNNLRYTLSDLRQIVGDYLLITPQVVGFQEQHPYWLDVEIVRTTLSTAPSQVSTPELQAALDLYHGEFLQGFHVRNAPTFEEWVTSQRTALHALVSQGLYQLAERYAQTGELNASLTATQRLLALEPWHEAAHRLRMSLFAHSGQRSAALAQFAQCQQVLATEFNGAPESATVRLYEQIRSGAHLQSIEGAAPKMPAPITIAAAPPPIPYSPPPVKLADHSQAEPAANSFAALFTPLHNLPGQLTSFIGRQQEITDLCTQLLNPQSRLITLVGEGGVGKTRLALAVAQSIADYQRASLAENPPAPSPKPRFPDGVWFVPLSGITETADLADHLAVAVGQAIGWQFSGNQPLLTQLLFYVRDKALLLLFDGAEHLLPGLADFLVHLLQGSPRSTILVTSRHVLNLQAELAWWVSGLAVPPPAEVAPLPPEESAAYSSSALFVERASRLHRDLPLTPANLAAIAAICRLVEGLPLALELAAALTRQYSCSELYAALQRDYTLLATSFADLSSRHRSLQATLDYSWRFLNTEEAHTLAACAIFAGGFTHQAVAYVTGANMVVLTTLVDQSLLQVHEGRFTMHELVRQYAADQLAQAPECQHNAQARHAAYYMALLDSMETTLLADANAQEAVQHELDNVRTAWRWSAAHGNLALLAMGLEGLQVFFRLVGLYREALHLLEMALTAVRQPVAALANPSFLTAGQPPLLARLLCHTAHFYRRVGELETGKPLAEEALEVGRQLADPALQGLAYHALARLAQARGGNFATMLTLAEQGVVQARLSASPHLCADCLNDLGIARGVCTAPLAAIPHFHQALHYLQGGRNRLLEGTVVNNLGFFYLAGHEYQAAHGYLQQAQVLCHQMRFQEGSGLVHILMGDLWVALGVYAKAHQEYGQALHIVQTVHDPYWESWLYASHGRLHHLCGDLAAARQACAFGRQVATTNGLHLQEQWALINLGHVLADLGDHAAARDCYQQAIALPKQVNWVYRTAEAHAGLAALLLQTNKVALAVTHSEAALALLDQLGLAGANEPFTVYWAAVQVFQTAGDSRATDVLYTACQVLQVVANELEDPQVQQAFLENVVVNRNLLTAAQAVGVI